MPTKMSATSIADSTSAGLTDTGLSFVAKAGYLYHFKGSMVLASAVTTTGPAIAFDTPASPTMFAAKANTPTTASVGTDNEEVDATITDAEQMTFTTSLHATGTLVQFEGYITPSVAGEFKVQFNTEVNASAVTFKGGRLDFTEIGLAA